MSSPAPSNSGSRPTSGRGLPSGFSVLGCSVLPRLGLALAATALLWLVIVWALR